MEDKIKLNDQTFTKEEFEKKIEELKQKPGVKVIKISENNYKVMLLG